MRELNVSKTVSSFDQIAIAFGDLRYHGINSPDKVATNNSAQYVLFNPADYYAYLVQQPRFAEFIDPETQALLINRGIVGYLWGASIALDPSVPPNHIVVSAECRETILVHEVVDGKPVFSDSPLSIMINVLDSIFAVGEPNCGNPC